jgi:hypothetical protein
MCEYWSWAGPPVYVSAAAYLGLIKKKPSKKNKGKGQQETGNLNELFKMAGPGGMFH